MKRTALWLAGLLSVCGVRGGASYAQQPSAPVYLSQSRDWRVEGGREPWVYVLARELTRQAFLLAARDEMGLVTRDAWLGDAKSPRGDTVPWDITATAGDPVILEIAHGFPPKPAVLARHEIPRSSPIDYRVWAAEAEALSRTKFVEALKQAGFQGQPHQRKEDVAVPEHVETLLGEMDFLSQFQSLRELHAAIRSQGESSALLGALVRGYANLGVMTEYCWHPAHKIFKARALLYAQRMLVRDEKSPAARWHRAYAAALTGLHAWALSDLDEAQQAWQALAEADRPPQPAWVQLIGPFCRYEIEALGRHVDSAEVRELAAMLRYLAVEQSGCPPWAAQTALEALPVIPECCRVYDGLREIVNIGTGHALASQPMRLMAEQLYSRVQSMPGLPEEVGRIARGQAFRGGSSATLPGKDSSGDKGEFSARRQLIDTLLHSGQPSPLETDAAKAQAAADSGEPSWPALGLLVRELSFVQVFSRAYFERNTLSTPPEEWLAAADPLVKGHPCLALLETFDWRAKPVKEALARLARMDVAGSAYPVRYFHDAFRAASDEKGAKAIYDKLYWNRDDVVRDLVSLVRWYSRSQASAGKQTLDTLLKVSPHSPMARSVLLEHHWLSAEVREKIDEWEKASASYPLFLSAFGQHYTRLGRWDDAERCLKAALKIVPVDLASCRQLAWIHLQRGETDLWLATLEQYLKQPDYGLEHFSVQAEIAGHYMGHKEWEKALPYAERAAESRLDWGLLAAARCNEALQRWEEAEKHYRACSERYRNSSLQWYFFCRRTGQSDVEKARGLAREFVENLAELVEKPDPFDLITYYLLEEQPEKAFPEVQQTVNKKPNAYDAIWMALIADRLKEAKKRDTALNRAKAIARPILDEADAPPNGPAGLVAFIVDDLAEGGEGQIDLDAADELAALLGASERVSFQYLIGQYLNLHGQPEAADLYWKECMGWQRIEAPYRTLAGAALVEHGVAPADYKELLRPDADEGEKMEEEE